MATMTVWKFDDADGAEQAERTLRELQSRGLITVHDAAIVSWKADAKRPKTKQLSGLTAGGALGGSFWGLLFGLIFFVPLLGAAVGAGLGALAASMSDVGIDDEFIKRTRAEIQPGTSALFVLSSGAVVDKVKEAFEGRQMQLAESNLSNEQEDRLRSVFTEAA